MLRGTMLLVSVGCCELQGPFKKSLDHKVYKNKKQR